MRQRLAWLALVGAVLGPRPTTASPMEDPGAGNTVFTGPTQPHASSIFLNPAALIFSTHGHHFYLGGSTRLDQVGIDRQIVDPETGALSDGPSVSATTWSPGGQLAYWLSVLEERAVLGLMLHTPFSERFIADQDALRYHTLGGYIYQAVLSAAGAFKVADWFVFGLGFSLGYSGVRLEFERDTALEAGSGPERGIASDCGGSPCEIENPLAAEHYTLDTRTGGLGGLFEPSNIGATLGIAVRIKQDWWAGLSYMSPPGALPGGRSVDLQLGGEVRVEEAPRDGGDAHNGRALVRYRMPQSVWLGVRGPVLPGYDLVAGGRWQNLSRHQQFELRMLGGDLEEVGVPEWYPRYRGMRDVFQLSGGLEGQDLGRIRFGGRARLETRSNTSVQVSPMQVEGWNAGLSGAVELPLTQHWAVTAGYDVTGYLPIDASSSAFDPMARLECVDSGYDFDRCRAAREGRAIPTAAGDYTRLRHTFLLSIRFDRL